MFLQQLASLLLNGIYLGVLLISSPWLAWRYFRQGKNRRGWAQKLLGQVPLPQPPENLEPDRASARTTDATASSTVSLEQTPQGDQPRCIWLHAVSVGEVNLLAPIIERLQRAIPNVQLIISTTTETGYDLALQKYSSLQICFFPFDFSWAVRRALERIQPDLIVLAELEIWPNFIRAAANFPRSKSDRVQRGVPVAVVNGRLSEKSFGRYRLIDFMIKPIFQQIRLIAAQDEVYAQRFRRLGAKPDSVHVTGSVKFDGVKTDRNNPLTSRLRELCDFQPDDFIFLAGSTQAGEDLLVAEVYLDLIKQYPQLRLILAPRHPARCNELVNQLQQLGLDVVRRSQLNEGLTFRSASSNPRGVLLIDVIGELGGWWGLADAAFVGGSLGSRGGQNMLEPAAFGLPVCFGPNTQNFRAIVEQLLAVDGAQVVANQEELKQFVGRVLTDRQWAQGLGSRAQQLVCQHRGAADRTIRMLLEIE